MRTRQVRTQSLTVAGQDKFNSFDDSARSAADFYHYLLTASWPMLLFQISVAFVAINLLFALAYYWAGGIDNARPGHFEDAFFFSVQTMGTIGYGRLSPVSWPANTIMSVEALASMIGLALMTGLIFAKFSRPTARVRFSRVCVVARRDGVPSLMIRMANVRMNQIVEAEIRVVLARQERTLEGEDVRRFHDLTLTRYRNAIFAFSWTAIHPIEPGSPIYETTPEELEAARAEVIVSVTGIDDTFKQTVYTRHTYSPSTIIWGARFVDITKRTAEGELAFDYTHFDDVEPAPLSESPDAASA